ncbi:MULTISPECIES: hypothetical protein [Hyphomonas]|nr:MULTISPECIES: hypothetical protein [Hyphomonas]MBB40951.1 hypothetical protein [Hyphomonas sp.]|tara:strand:+ start:3201 stop:5546 length:2346 start_codon:yes stop_codon:yes gene_type:complete
MTDFPAPIDGSWDLEDGAAAITASRAGRVGGVARVYDFGVDTLFDGFMVFDVSAIDTSGDAVYGLKFQLCAASDFSSGVVDVTAPSLAMAGTGQQGVIVTNQVIDTKYRYGRIWIEATGTSPSVTLSSWLIHKDSLDDYSIAQLTGILSVAATRFTNASQEFRAWTAGTVTGGPNSDGEYPLSDGVGNSYLVPCPAKIAASAGVSFAAINGLTERTTPYAGADAGPDIMISQPAASNLRKGKLFLFAARRTQDLENWNEILGTELIPAYRASSGLEGRIALDEILRRATGVINPYNYGCKGDAVYHRQGITTVAGSDIVEANEAIYDRASVGQVIQLSNAAAGGQPLKTTITEVINDTHVRMAVNAGNSQAGQDCLFGTVDTAGMQAALDAAAPQSTFTYGGVVILPYGGFLCGALTYQPRSALFGTGGIRQSAIFRHDDGATHVPIWGYYGDDDSDGIINEDDPDYANSEPAPQLRAVNRHCDFNAFGDFALIGARYCQSVGYGGFSAKLEIGARAMAQTDPYPFYSRMHVAEHGWHGWEQGGRHSGSMVGVEIIDNGGVGLWLQAYDANVTNILCIGNTGPGMFVEEGQGANNNILSAKISFNGTGGLTYVLGSIAGTSNMVVAGTGNNITNARLQESYGNNLTVAGSRNQFGDIGLDDTGNIAYKDGGNPALIAGLPDIRAAVALGFDADFNRFNDVGYGGAVQAGQNFATHGVYHFDANDDGGGRSNSGRFYTKDVPSYWSSDTTSTPGAIGAETAFAPHASNYYTIDDQSIASLYP